MKSERIIISGRKIKHLRQKMDLSQNAMGKRLGMSGANVGKIEKGQINPTIEQYKQIAEVLEADVIDIMCLNYEAPDDQVDRVEEQLGEYKTSMKGGQADVTKAVEGLISSLQDIIREVKKND